MLSKAQLSQKVSYLEHVMKAEMDALEKEIKSLKRKLKIRDRTIKDQKNHLSAVLHDFSLLAEESSAVIDDLAKSDEKKISAMFKKHDCKIMRLKKLQKNLWAIEIET